MFKNKTWQEAQIERALSNTIKVLKSCRFCNESCFFIAKQILPFLNQRERKFYFLAEKKNFHRRKFPSEAKLSEMADFTACYLPNLIDLIKVKYGRHPPKKIKINLYIILRMLRLTKNQLNQLENSFN